MNISRIVLLASLMLFFFARVSAQQYIEGTVYEESENGDRTPLPGVNVYWKIVNEGTVTDADGHYKIPVHGQIGCLVFSCVSYENDTVHHMFDPVHYDHIFRSIHMLNEVQIEARQKALYISNITPIAVQSITSEGLRRAACCSLAESFENSASVDVSYSDAVTGAKQIELLGLSGLYTQMMAENMPNFRGLASAFGLSYVPGTWMNSIQVSKGTSSVRNGYESISGQINVDFKKPEDGEKLFLNLYGNSMTMAEFNFNTRWKMGKHGNMMVLGHANYDFMSMDDNGDGFMDDPHVAQGTLFLRYDYLNEHFDGIFGAKILNERRFGGKMGGNPFVHPMSDKFRIGTTRYEMFAKTGFIFDRDNTSLGLQQQFVFHDLGSSYFGRTAYYATQYSYYANLLFDSYIVNEKHKYTLGASYTFDQYDERLWWIPTETDSVYGRKEHVPGAFVEYVFNDDHHWSTIVGMRADYNTYYQKMLYTPRLHVRYKTHDNLTLRASAGKGYRSPNVLAENSTMLASARKLVFVDTPEMEEAWNYGVNLTKIFSLGWRELTLSADFYRTDFINQIVLDRDADAHQIRIYNLDGKSYSNSTQIEANCEIFKDFDLTLAFRYNDVKMTINDSLREKPFVNRYKGLVTMSYAPGTWQFDFTTQFNGDSRVPNLNGNTTAVANGQAIERSPFYVIMNAQVTKELGKYWELYLGGENLTNYKQTHPIISAENPMSDDFDASMVWGPLSGVRGYVGVRFQIK